MPDVIDTTQQIVESIDGSDTQTTETDTKDVSGSEQKETDDGTATGDGEKTDAEKAEAAAKVKTEADAKQKAFMGELLLEYDLESPEQLAEFIKDLKGLKTKVGSADIDDLIDNKALMTKYQKHWAAQEANKQKEGETEAETIKRLEDELKVKDKADQEARSQSDDLKETEKAVEVFNATVTKTIKGIASVPEEYRSFLGLFMGADNPINEVDLKDRGKIIELTKSGAKQLMDFEQIIIQRYMKGKTEVPAVTNTTETNTDTGEKPIKNISDARKRLAEVVQATLLKKKQ